MPDPKPQQTSLDKAHSVVEELLGLSKRLGKTGGSSKESSKESESRGHYQQQDDTKHGENKPSLEDEGWEPPEPDLPQREKDTRTIEGVTLLKEHEAERTAVQQGEIKEVVESIFKAYSFETFVTSKRLKKDMPPNAIVPFQQALGNRMRNEWLLNAQQKMLFLVRLYYFVYTWSPTKNKLFFRNAFFRNALKDSNSDEATMSNDDGEKYPDEIDVYIELWLSADRDLENQRLKWSELTRDRFQEWITKLRKLENEGVVFAKDLCIFYLWLDKLFDEREVDWTYYRVRIPELNMETRKEKFREQISDVPDSYTYKEENSLWWEVLRFFDICRQSVTDIAQRSSDKIVLSKLMDEINALSFRGEFHPLEHNLFHLLNRHWRQQVSYLVQIMPDLRESLLKDFTENRAARSDPLNPLRQALLTKVENEATISSIPGLKFQLKEWINKAVDETTNDFPLLDTLFASAFLQIAAFYEDVEPSTKLEYVQVNIINRGKMPAARLHVQLRLHKDYEEDYQIVLPILFAEREKGEAEFQYVKEKGDNIFDVTEKLLPEKMVSLYVPLKRKKNGTTVDRVDQLVEFKVLYEDRMQEHGERKWEKWESDASHLLSLGELWDADLNASSIEILKSKPYSPLVLPALVCEAGGTMQKMSLSWRANCPGLILSCLVDVLANSVKEHSGYFGLAEWFSVLKDKERLFRNLNDTRLKDFLFLDNWGGNPREEWRVVLHLFQLTSTSGNSRCDMSSVLKSIKNSERENFSDGDVYADRIRIAVSNLIRRRILGGTVDQIYIRSPFISRLCNYVP